MYTMLSTPVSVHKQLHHYTPHVPSPLSSSPLQSSPPVSPLEPRNANIPSRLQQRDYEHGMQSINFMISPASSPPNISHSERMTSHGRSPSRDSGPYCKRITKSNPLIHGQSDGRETRRKLFLRKVREDSEEKRWKARGGDDEMMRTIWIAEQRRRAERQARDAAGWTVDVDDHEQDMELDAASGGPNFDEVMADEVARNEEEELEALLASMTEAERRQTLDAAYESVSVLDEEIGPIDAMEAAAWARGDMQHSLSQHDMMVMDLQRQVHASSPETHYGSDDGDYDAIFMDVMQEESKMFNNTQGDQEMMDMS